MKSDAVDVRLLQIGGGRHLGVSEYGLDSGYPVVFCHGFPSSRVGAAFLATAAREAGARLIAIDRPGIGLSTPQGSRKVVDWAQDVQAVVDELGIENFSVIGVGRGSPYAFAVAAGLPKRVLALVTTRVPTNSKDESRGRNRFLRYASWLGRKFPFLHAIPLSIYHQALRAEPSEGLARLVEALPQEDRRLLNDHQARAVLLADIREAFRQGLDGPVEDAIVLERDWGFRITDVRCPVQIWRGEKDGSPEPKALSVDFARMPNARLNQREGRGAIGLLLRDGPDIFWHLAHA